MSTVKKSEQNTNQETLGHAILKEKIPFKFTTEESTLCIQKEGREEDSHRKTSKRSQLTKNLFNKSKRGIWLPKDPKCLEPRGLPAELSLKCPYRQNFYFPIRSYIPCNELWCKKFSIWIKSDIFMKF